jgi:nucleoside-diphosphate-sugar epimerase
VRKVLVTGVAGFIGSHLAERLVARGLEVVGVDAFTDYYPRAIKEANIAALRGSRSFTLVETDLAVADLGPLLDGVDAVVHLAAQAGVRASWGASFATYLDCNIRATQRLLEAARTRTISKFVYASSSSVYGETPELPMRESGRTLPVSPYGVTKLAAENLAVLYHRSFGVPTVSLRYFTVYGPRQRPDMAFHRFIRAGLAGAPVEVFGDGGQTRDFTFVSDVVDATEAALMTGPPGEVINVAGGSRVTLNHALSIIEAALERPVRREHRAPASGDVTDTLADNRKAADLLGFRPRVGLEEGLPLQCAWMRGSA